MKTPLTGWADSPASQRREPTAGEVANGFSCGPPDREIFNEHVYRANGTALEIKSVCDEAGVPLTDGIFTNLRDALRKLYPRNNLSPVIWVRTDGNDANDGSANTAGAALATINAAVTLGKRLYNLAGVNLTVRLGNTGTYAPIEILGCAGTITILGADAAQDSYIISGARPMYAQAANIILRGLQLYNNNTSHSTCHAAYLGAIFLDKVTLGGSGSTNTGTAHLYADTGGVITAQGNIKVQSNQGSAFFCRGGDIQITTGVACSFAGSPSFALATAAVRGPNMMQMQGVVFSGAANGARYSIVANGVVDTNGESASFIPGSSAGAVSSGGQYV